MIRLLICGLGKGYDGVSNVIMGFVANADKELFDIYVTETYDSAYHDSIVENGCKIVKLPLFKKYFAYKKAVKNLFAQQSFDVVWINNTSKVDLQIMKNAKKQGAKVIVHSHGSVQEGGFLKRTAFELLNRLHEKKFYGLLDYGIACSQSSADYFFNKKYMKEKPLKVLVNAIDCEKYAFSDEKRIVYRNELSLSEGEIALACIGRLCAVKNLGFAVRILNSLPNNYRLFFVGDGEREPLEKEIEKLSLQDRAFLLGRRTDVSDLINAFDIILLPSISEGLPLTILEAQANGLKCIVSANVGDDCKFLQSLEFIAIDDPNIWAEAIKNADFSRCANAKERAAEKRADIKEYVKTLTEIFLSVK